MNEVMHLTGYGVRVMFLASLHPCILAGLPTCVRHIDPPSALHAASPSSATGSVGLQDGENNLTPKGHDEMMFEDM